MSGRFFLPFLNPRCDGVDISGVFGVRNKGGRSGAERAACLAGCLARPLARAACGLGWAGETLGDDLGNRGEYEGCLRDLLSVVGLLRIAQLVLQRSAKAFSFGLWLGLVLECVGLEGGHLPPGTTGGDCWKERSFT